MKSLSFTLVCQLADAREETKPKHKGISSAAQAYMSHPVIQMDSLFLQDYQENKL